MEQRGQKRLWPVQDQWDSCSRQGLLLDTPAKANRTRCPRLMELLRVAALLSLLAPALGGGSSCGGALEPPLRMDGDAAEVLLEDDECSSCDNGVNNDDSCALNALQLRKSSAQAPPPLPATAAPSGREVTTWDELKAVVQASKGGRIHIPAGIQMDFRGTININEGTHFDIWSEGAVLNGRNSWGQVRLFYVRGLLSLNGFIIENGKTDYAGAVYFDFESTGNITNCVFRKNEATYMGGAIVSKGAHLTMYNVSFHDNHAHNTCLSKLHCSRRRRNGRRSNAMYILSHTKLDASLGKQPKTQDIFYDKDFDGKAIFPCGMPRMEAAVRTARRYVHRSSNCTLPSVELDE